MSDSSSKPIHIEALEEAIRRCGGSQTELARRIGKTQGHVSTWLGRGKCAADAVLKIEAATGVSRHRLRPDVFGFEPIPAPEEQHAEAAE